MSMGRRRRKSGAENDATTPWKSVLKYMGRSGVSARIKRQIRRRERREGRDEARGSDCE